MCGRLVNLDTVARVLADYYHLKTETQLAALDEALSRVPAVSVVGGHGKDHVADPGKMVGDLISRTAVIDELEERLRANGYTNVALVSELNRCIGYIMRLPSAQPGWSEQYKNKQSNCKKMPLPKPWEGGEDNG